MTALICDSAPVDALGSADGALVRPADHPGNPVIECSSRSAVTISPGDILVKSSMLLAKDALRPILDRYRHTVKVRCSPGTFFLLSETILDTFVFTEREAESPCLKTWDECFLIYSYQE